MHGGYAQFYVNKGIRVNSLLTSLFTKHQTYLPCIANQKRRRQKTSDDMVAPSDKVKEGENTVNLHGLRTQLICFGLCLFHLFMDVSIKFTWYKVQMEVKQVKHARTTTSLSNSCILICALRFCKNISYWLHIIWSLKTAGNNLLIECIVYRHDKTDTRVIFTLIWSAMALPVWSSLYYTTYIQHTKPVDIRTPYILTI